MEETHQAEAPRNLGTRPLREPEPPQAGAAAAPASGQIAAAAVRDIGQLRQVNQDHVFALTATLPREGSDMQMGLYIVADGMGGHDGGEVASRMAISAAVRHVLVELMVPALDESVSTAIRPMIVAAVQDANRSIWEHARGMGSDMGTTCTLALLLGHTIYIGHVGDTRAYLISPKEIRRLTDDHSAVGRLIEMGQLDVADAREHPLRSQLYRTVGQTPDVAVDIVSAQQGDATHLLLASDGLWSLVDDEDLRAAVLAAATPQAACEALVARANAAGGDDNISAVVVQLQ
jgi:PPM family protein phosphatase